MDSPLASNPLAANRWAASASVCFEPLWYMSSPLANCDNDRSGCCDWDCDDCRTRIASWCDMARPSALAPCVTRNSPESLKPVMAEGLDIVRRPPPPLDVDGETQPSTDLHTALTTSTPSS